MSAVLWSPSEAYQVNSTLFKYKKYIEFKYNLIFENYDDLHQWSIDHVDIFWESILSFFEITFDNQYDNALQWDLNQDSFIDAKWFEGIKLSYAEHIFKQYSTDRPAIKFTNEENEYVEISWKTLTDNVSSIQQYLQKQNIKKGDRVVGVLNNTADTIAVFLAVNSIGAIWSCCSPDFGDKSIADRFVQIQPKILFIQSSYQYNNRIFNKAETSTYLLKSIPSIVDVIDLNSSSWQSIFDRYEPKEVFFERVTFSHPIWVLYSSGTTGIPKAITHSTGGNLVEHYKALALHQNVQKGDNFLWYTTTGWMMWNYALSSLLCGATLCLFDGIINHNQHLTFFNFLKRAKVDHLGAGAVYFTSIAHLSFDGYTPKVIGSTGSPLPPSTFEALQKKFPQVHIISLSGGTDVCSAFLTGCSLLPVYAGQLQCKALGVDLHSVNQDGNNIMDEVGELIIRKPIPSMPLYFWNDFDNLKYKESYFERYKAVWAHGDWIKIISGEGIIIYGRSDATLNRGGVRIGTAEIYNTVNTIEGIKDSLVITVEYENGDAKMILFVQLEDDQSISDELISHTNSLLRKENSPRHVPDFIFQVTDIPYTLSGKKLELPIKKIFSGVALDKVVSKEIMRNSDCLHEYAILKERFMN